MVVCRTVIHSDVAAAFVVVCHVGGGIVVVLWLGGGALLMFLLMLLLVLFFVAVFIAVDCQTAIEPASVGVAVFMTVEGDGERNNSNNSNNSNNDNYSKRDMIKRLSIRQCRIVISSVHALAESCKTCHKLSCVILFAVVVAVVAILVF